MSISTTSGRSDAHSDTASRPSAASPTTSMSGWLPRITAKPARISRWSSATTTVIATRTPIAREPNSRIASHTCANILLKRDARRPATPDSRRMRTARLVGPVDVVAGALLSVVVFCLVTVPFFAEDPRGNAAAGLAAILLTLPVIAARRWPVPAPAMLTVAALLNWLLVGHHIRCGAALPAAFWVAAVLGLKTRGWPSALGLALVLGNVVVQSVSDPQLGPIALPSLAAITIGFWVAGRAIGVRGQALRRVAEQNRHIEQTRELTSRMAVAVDRERIAEGLNGRLQRRISDLGAEAAAARHRLDEPGSAARFAAIAEEGRRTLTEMRSVVGDLRTDGLLGATPDLERLAALVTAVGGRIDVESPPPPEQAPLTAAVSRMVAQLIAALTVGPPTPPSVTIRFAADVLEARIGTAGPAGPSSSEIGPEWTSVRHEVQAHGGTLQRLPDRRQWVIRLPALTSDA